MVSPAARFEGESFSPTQLGDERKVIYLPTRQETPKPKSNAELFLDFRGAMMILSEHTIENRIVAPDAVYSFWNSEKRLWVDKRYPEGLYDRVERVTAHLTIQSYASFQQHLGIATGLSGFVPDPDKEPLIGAEAAGKMGKLLNEAHFALVGRPLPAASH
ncbi:MAG: hypothetical protein Q8Q49_02020 [bacterium]|nr:hypothetical protein [bacterium]